MRPKLLTAHNVEVNTASVVIKTLQLEGKQITLAVFRQIIEEDIIQWEPRAELKGIGWGHVRYQVEDDFNNCINLIWQKGSELRRCLVKRRHGLLLYGEGPKIRVHYNDSNRVQFLPAELRVGSGDLNLFFNESHKEYVVPGSRAFNGGNVKIYAHYHGMVDYSVSEGDRDRLLRNQEEAKDWLQSTTNLWKEKLERRDTLVNTLWNLPQLFIAV